jgi:hypothetical protein
MLSSAAQNPLSSPSAKVWFLVHPTEGQRESTLDSLQQRRSISAKLSCIMCESGVALYLDVTVLHSPIHD